MSNEGTAHARPLQGSIAIVTGASRGGGRGIAVELGAAGATVYVTGRSTRTAQPATYAGIMAQAGLASMPGTIEDTADEVTRLGGTGIAVACDHTRDDDVRALIARVTQEQGRLDLLVNNAWGGHETFDHRAFALPFWEQPLEQWEGMFSRGVRNHIVASRHAAPLLVRQHGGLIITTTYWDGGDYLGGNLFYDLAKASMTRLAFAMAEELREHGVSSLALSPGWMRTELVLAFHNADESNWQQRPELARTESPRYIGRAVVALATDPAVSVRSGGVYRAADLAAEYGFTDVDGRQVPAYVVSAA